MSPTQTSGKDSAMVSAGGDLDFAQHTEEIRIDEQQVDPSYQAPAAQDHGQAASSDIGLGNDLGSAGQDLLDALGLEGLRSSQHPPGPSLPLRALTPGSGRRVEDSPQTQPSWSTLERGRVSVRSGRGREPSTEDGRFTRLTSLLEHMMVRMDRLEDDRSSRRSSASQAERPSQGWAGFDQGSSAVQWGGYGVGFVGLDLGSSATRTVRHRSGSTGHATCTVRYQHRSGSGHAVSAATCTVRHQHRSGSGYAVSSATCTVRHRFRSGSSGVAASFATCTTCHWD